MNADTGDKRVNKSWVLSRLLRDWEKRAKYDYSEPALVVAIFKVREEDRKQGDMTDRAWGRVQDLEKNKKAKVDASTMQAGVPELDLQWYTGILVIIAQLIIATIAGIFLQIVAHHDPHCRRYHSLPCRWCTAAIEARKVVTPQNE